MEEYYVHDWEFDICSCEGEEFVLWMFRFWPMDLRDLGIFELNRVLAYIVVQSYLFECIKAHHYDDFHLLVLGDIVLRGGS